MKKYMILNIWRCGSRFGPKAMYSFSSIENQGKNLGLQNLSEISLREIRENKCLWNISKGRSAKLNDRDNFCTSFLVPFSVLIWFSSQYREHTHKLDTNPKPELLEAIRTRKTNKNRSPPPHTHKFTPHHRLTHFFQSIFHHILLTDRFGNCKDSEPETFLDVA